MSCGLFSLRSATWRCHSASQPHGVDLTKPQPQPASQGTTPKSHEAAVRVQHPSGPPRAGLPSGRSPLSSGKRLAAHSLITMPLPQDGAFDNLG
jgi:hypothetical protein